MYTTEDWNQAVSIAIAKCLLCFWLIGDKLNRHNATTGEYAQACVQVARDCGTDVLDLWTMMQKDEVWWHEKDFETVMNCEMHHLA